MRDCLGTLRLCRHQTIVKNCASRLCLIRPTPFLDGSQSYFVRGCKLQLKTALSLLAEVIQNIGMATPSNNFLSVLTPCLVAFAPKMHKMLILVSSKSTNLKAVQVDLSKNVENVDIRTNLSQLKSALRPPTMAR